MINHARCLLVNQSANVQAPDGCPGEELIDPSFTAVTLPTYLQQIRTILFGGNPDRCMLNYRAAQLLGLVGATELQQYVVAFDPRLTYPSATDLLSDGAFNPRVITYGGDAVAIQGEPSVPDQWGRCYFEFDLTLTGSTVQLTEQSPEQQNRFCSVTFADGLSSAVPLGDSGYSILVPQNGQAWKVTCFNRPQWDMGQLVPALEIIGEAVLLQLFGVKPTGSYKSFYDCWSLHKSYAYRLAAIVMALVYRTEEIRTEAARG